MQLVADRFAVTGDRRVLDLATGAAVVLKVAGAGSRSEQTRWAIRCDGLQKLRHRCLATLLDYGLLGERERFEAWLCGPRWTGRRAVADDALKIVSRFLTGCGLTFGSEASSGRAVRSSPRGVVVVPDETSGYATDESCGGPGDDRPLNAYGLELVEREPLTALAELFELTGDSRPHVMTIVGPAGSGRTTLVLELARIARLRGFLPIAARLASTFDSVHGRSLCLIDDGSSRECGSALVEAAVRGPCRHIIIRTALAEMSASDGIKLARMSAESLVSAVRPQIVGPRVLGLVQRAAARAQGLPGSFVQLLWKDQHDIAAADHKRPASRAAEQPTTYDVDELLEREACAPVRTLGGPASGELDALRHQIPAAVRLIETGRYEPGVRTLRQAVGGLARREDWVCAGEGAMALASALLGRGQPEAAHQVLESAAQYCARSGRNDVLLDIATLRGEAWIDRARLNEAESVIGAALASARGSPDALQSRRASLALGRCLFWRGRYADADDAIAPVDDRPFPIGLQMRTARLRARIAVGKRDFARAMTLASQAAEQARRVADDRAMAAATCTKAFVHLSVGDVDAAASDSRASIAAARSARDPLRAARARLVLAEIDRRANRPRAASAIVNRLRHVARDRLPPLLRLRCDLLHELLSSANGSAEVVVRRTASTGLQALTLYLPDASTVRPGPAGWDFWTDEIVDILGLCQTAEDETTVLGEVCSKVRRQLHAAGVAYVAGERGALIVVASSGNRIDLGVAVRAVDAGVTIAPYCHDDRIEAAAPVKHSGSVLGALVARWTPGTPYDLSRASAVLTVAASAATSAISAVLARRTGVGRAAVSELLGAAPVMVELRRSVERAAAAPFAVLVVGESGAGKELVARDVHRLGPRRDRPFCTLNCAALPEDLIEAELFGHVRGAFTGAVGDRPGVFEDANGGTLFLDELGELSARAQAKLLRVVQEGELRRVGENLSRRIDVRIVAATNRELRQEAAAGHFRTDLLYRLDVIRLSVPPLRDRLEDIAILVDHFWREATARVGSHATLAPTTVAALARYDWPGNVRELQNVLAALAVRCPKRGVVPPTTLPPQLFGPNGPEPCRLEDARRTFEERFVRAALVRTGGHRSRAAEELGVTRQGLTKLMARLGISDH